MTTETLIHQEELALQTKTEWHMPANPAAREKQNAVESAPSASTAKTLGLIVSMLTVNVTRRESMCDRED